ncbi:MAG: 3-isopropylmalate/(R)-2-methylmalate dehydratase small subunit [Alphaproteobacteria bacterium]|jgi:3-isopropylmalate/(R)-2-methylmalate dehydratase small subunit|nr:3-isopropylmalate/(R)-2-methylmalate dehydratase small subunit [Alphaproteobacteria bacterium]
MQPFTVLTAVAAPLEIAKIDTGMILPGRYMRRHRRPGHDYGEAFLYDLRFDDNGKPRADFPTNQPAYRDAKILVTDQDFGCGSSREGAAFAVMDFGLQALVGVSFGEIFQGNCIQNGIVAVTLPEAAIHDLWGQLREKPGAEITIDLPNQTVIAPDGRLHGFDISPLRKDRLVRGIDDIDVTLEYRDAIEAFETRRRAAVPWLPTAQRD